MSELKIYLNENLSWKISKALREHGYDVTSSHEVNMNSATDIDQFEYAISQGRTVVTNNFSDFFELDERYHREGKYHYGIIFTTECNIPTLTKRLKSLLQTVSVEQLKNQIRWLNEFQ